MTSPSIGPVGVATPRVLLGVGLVIFGVVLMLDRVGIVRADVVARFWPLILIAIGAQQWSTARSSSAGHDRFPLNAAIWMGVGGLLLLNSLGIMRSGVRQLIGPAVLILIGVWLVTRSSWQRRAQQDQLAGDATADTGPVFAVMSGVKRVSAPVSFGGTDITVFMGGALLDLRRAVLKRGQEAIIDVTAVMGGCELFVPPDWIVSAPLIAVLGGVDDKRLPLAPTVIEEATSPSAAPPRLVLRGLVLMGGVTIRS